MELERADIAREYAAALRQYLSGGGEEELMRASLLGSRAMSGGLGVLELVQVHHEALVATVECSTPLERRRRLEAASLFLCEALSRFELMHRGFREATEVARAAVWMASVVSHELKTPLTSVLNSAGMLRELLGEASTSIETKLLDNVLTAAQILQARTDELHDLVGLHTGTLPIKIEPLDIGAVVRSVAQRFEVDAAAEGLTLVSEVEESLPLIPADGKRMEQVVSNLLQNAIKYGSEGRRIDVRVLRAADTLVLEVQDYGAGISLWDRLRLFEPSFRGQPRGKEVPGVGLGLAVCRALVELHHGSITVESDAGKGSLFRVVLPVESASGLKGGAEKGGAQ